MYTLLMEKIDLYNQISREIVKNYNTYLHVEDVKIQTSPDVPAHYTIVHLLDKQIADKLHQVALKLKELDPSLILNLPENYHITFFWKGLESKLEDKVSEIESIISSTRFDFNINELLFGPLGISVKFYPSTEGFVNARFKIYELADTPVSVDEKFVTTWVHLAAFSQIPQESVKKFVQENSKISFGSYTAKNFTLYISTNKGLVKPTKIREFSCKD
jgi:2'-5' RNA ligase